MKKEYDNLAISPDDVVFVPVHQVVETNNSKKFGFSNRRILLKLNKEGRYLDVTSEKEFDSKDSNFGKFLKDNRLGKYAKNSELINEPKIDGKLSSFEEGLFASIQQIPSDNVKTSDYYDSQQLLTSIMKFKKIKSIDKFVWPYIKYDDIKNLQCELNREDYILVDARLSEAQPETQDTTEDEDAFWL